MLSIKFISKNPELVKKGIKAKGVDESLVQSLLQADNKRVELIKKIEDIRAKRNYLADKIKQTKKPTQKNIRKGKQLKQQLKKLEPDLKEVQKNYRRLLYLIPNLPADDVPLGSNETDNVKVKKWGKVPQFNFKVKDHYQLAKDLDLIDVERAAKVAGSRFGYLKNEAVFLEFSLIRLGLKTLQDHGFTPFIPPVLIKDKMMKAMGYLEHGGDKETYFLEKDNLYLIGTSEQSLGPYHAGEVLDKNSLPLKYVAFSTCFRREAGTYGKDTRGIFRVHQFDKLEMFVFSQPKVSDQEHEKLLAIEEELVQKLKLPYRVLKMCTGDLGHPAARKYDIECWFPAEAKYRETHSVSNCTAYQARRLRIKYKTKGGEDKLVHTLNGTFFSQRLILAILENYQQKDGSVKIPKILRKWVGKDTIEKPGK
jgi:seryl-tRNA synthetase